MEEFVRIVEMGISIIVLLINVLRILFQRAVLTRLKDIFINGENLMTQLIILSRQVIFIGESS